jgi:hypothetical protein
VCSSSLEAAVLAVRLVHALDPRFNRTGRWQGYRYVRGVGGRAPRLAVARRAVRAGPGWLGPLPSTGAARTVVAAVTAAVGDGRPAIDRLAAAVAGDGEAVLGLLRRRFRALADAGRHEDAVAAGEGLEAVERALRRQLRIDALRRVERVVADLPSGAGVELRRGRLVRAWGPGGLSGDMTTGSGRHGVGPAVGRAVAGGPGAADDELRRLCQPAGDLPLPPLPDEGPVPLEMADELATVASWLDRHAARLRLVHVEGDLCGVVPGESGADPGGLRCRAC